ncbi:hypothetical protein LbFV_ORF39 [Leptopilina boulardi filamentous virus]|uniref:Uncharacterized protein n=1 Tax=Leptopilina boulardi filamentous virus TaxID=552509 RepID=A0A1S5YCZ9_9VIRU|nr:hypothetical protein LbFV_ORF39 [Leptopilina boulardi filamentous virus]AQQ79959.1 hypothetical protein LbFV_ORF39 [Leptopilina boulardi filamentous virus]
MNTAINSNELDTLESCMKKMKNDDIFLFNNENNDIRKKNLKEKKNNISSLSSSNLKKRNIQKKKTNSDNLQQYQEEKGNYIYISLVIL